MKKFESKSYRIRFQRCATARRTPKGQKAKPKRISLEIAIASTEIGVSLNIDFQGN